MYYINQSILSSQRQTKSSKKILISILSIQPQFRNESDHEHVYRFFYDNKILQDIERIKSQNAKQQCIANLTIATRKPDNIIDINLHNHGVGVNNTGHGGQRGDDSNIRQTDYENNVEIKQKQIGMHKQKKQQQIIQRQNIIGNQQQNDRNYTNRQQDIVKSIKKQPIQSNTYPQSHKNMIIMDKLTLPEQEHNQHYYILLSQQKYQQIMAKDQKYLRRNIQTLKKYTILSQMKYSQLLYLAYYMNTISYKYKQDVYRQGDQVDYLYLVERGEFHYGKRFTHNAHAHNNASHHYNHNVHLQNRYISNTKKNRPKRYDAKLANPNRVKNSMSIQHKIGVIQGQSGQSFGQEQIMTQTKRQYNITCMSTQNLLIRIPKDKYKKVMCTSYTKIQWLKKQNKRKIGFKDQIFNKIMDVKTNYKKYTSLINQQNLNKTEKVRAAYMDQYTYKQIQNLTSKSRSKNKSRGILPKIRSRSIASQDQYSIQRSQHSLGRSQIIQQEQKQNSNIIKKSQKSKMTEQNQHNGTFDLTGGDYTRKRKHRKKQQLVQRQKDISSVHVAGTNSNNLILPNINTEKQKTISAHQTLQTNIVKNWSASRPMIELKGLRNKFSGMIDSNSLIRQKQQILNMKLLRNKNQREDLYPLDVPQKINQKIQVGGLPTKQETRQMRSAAHSKAFMQKLLVQALKKAGYNSNKSGEQNYTSDTPNSIVDIKNNLRIPKSKPIRGEKNNSSHLLEDNAFDQCYFKKM